MRNLGKTHMSHVGAAVGGVENTEGCGDFLKPDWTFVYCSGDFNIAFLVRSNCVPEFAQAVLA